MKFVLIGSLFALELHAAAAIPFVNRITGNYTTSYQITGTYYTELDLGGGFIEGNYLYVVRDAYSDNSQLVRVPLTRNGKSAESRIMVIPFKRN
jgi:hypothetical protein